MSVESLDTAKEKASAAFDYAKHSGAYTRAAYVFIALLAVYAIARGVLAAAVRPLWWDELFTLTAASQPNLHGLLAVASRGFDIQPPAFDLLERATLVLPVKKEVALRLPSILGFACALLCVFAYVKKRAGEWIACLCAFLLLSTSVFTTYLTEARPYSLLVACIAFALVCYQRLPSLGWTGLFALSLIMAGALHYYAVFAMMPFWFAEGVVFLRTRRFRWLVWLALVCGLLPLMASLRLLLGSRTFFGAHYYSLPVLARVPEFYGTYFLIPDVWGVGLAVVSLAAIAFSRFHGRDSGLAKDTNREFDYAEGTLLGSLVTLPLITYVFLRVMHGGLLDRHVLATALGVVLGLACLLSLIDRRATAFFALLVLCGVGVRELRFWHHSGLDPRAHDASALSFAEFGDVQKLVQSAGHFDLPVVFSQSTLYGQVVYYCPPDFTSRLVHFTDKAKELKYVGNDTNMKTVKAFGEFFPLRLVDYTKFTSEHSEFLMYSEPSEWSLFALRDEGAEVQVLKVDGNRWLYLVKMKGDATH